jgi:lipoprotein-anchoring transpeptidase ErfK/SrfK
MLPSAPYVALAAVKIAALPEASYSAVIAGLIGYAAAGAPSTATSAYSLATDTALYGAGTAGAVARLPSRNFLGTNTVVVPVETSGDWTLVLTPSRESLPSRTAGNAPAQTAAWIRTASLTGASALRQKIVVSVGKQTLSIVNRDGTVAASFSVAVGAPTTPTPTGVTGYLQARYLDPTQGQAVHPIQLTSLHSSAADEPFGGHDGGLIGLHFQTVTSGAVSHGCVRLTAAAVVAVNMLPLGTLVTLAP